MSYILSELYYDWFNNENYWFDKNLNNDIYLTKKYYKYINKIYLENNLKQELIGAIILLDQIYGLTSCWSFHASTPSRSR